MKGSRAGVRMLVTSLEMRKLGTNAGPVWMRTDELQRVSEKYDQVLNEALL